MLEILYEDKYILAVHKPAGLATQTSKVYEKDLVSEVNAYLAQKQAGNSSRNQHVGLINRLDQPVEGIVLFGLNPKTTANLTKMLQDGKIDKYYYAAVSCDKDCYIESDSWLRVEDYLVKDGKTNTSRVVQKNENGAKKAILDYKIMTIKQDEHLGLLNIHLITGRHHQIRVQMSHAGLPLMGDLKYAPGSVRDMSRTLGIRTVALCAYNLIFNHPVSGDKVNISIKPNGLWFEMFGR